MLVVCLYDYESQRYLHQSASCCRQRSCLCTHQKQLVYNTVPDPNRPFTGFAEIQKSNATSYTTMETHGNDNLETILYFARHAKRECLLRRIFFPAIMRKIPFYRIISLYSTKHSPPTEVQRHQVSVLFTGKMWIRIYFIFCTFSGNTIVSHVCLLSASLALNPFSSNSFHFTQRIFLLYSFTYKNQLNIFYFEKPISVSM